MFPKYKEIEEPLLRELLRRGGRGTPMDGDEQGRSIYTALADEFSLSGKARGKVTADGEGRLHWEKMVRWARQKLCDRGLLISSPRGVWVVTAKGRSMMRRRRA